MSDIKTSVKFGRIEFAFYPDLLELAQSSDYPVIKAQTFTQETYHGHQLLHIRKVASDKIRKLRQLAVLLLVSVSYLLYYALIQTGTARKIRYFHIGVLCYVAVEYALWLSGCLWPGYSISNPYCWFDLLLTGCLFALLPATGKAVQT